MTRASALPPTPARAVGACLVALAVALGTGVPAASAASEPADQSELLALLDELREGHGLPPLHVDDRLVAAAADHAGAMAAAARLFHTPLTGPAEVGRLGENVAMAATASAAHQALLRSDGHRRAMLDPGFSAVGIGVAHRDDGSHWISMKLAASPPAAGPGPVRTADAAGVVTVAPGWAHHGDLRHVPLAAPVVGMATTPSGAGYWLVAADGGVFAFGDAPFLGSAATRALASPIVRINRRSTGRGYALYAADGTRHGFGDAR